MSENEKNKILFPCEKCITFICCKSRSIALREKRFVPSYILYRLMKECEYITNYLVKTYPVTGTKVIESLFTLFNIHRPYNSELDHSVAGTYIVDEIEKERISEIITGKTT